ncbi:centriole and centriolar satellite protein ofd1 isoform X4 [Sinocyclocheilus anshuiensis]|uniref:centriole and centriolar satellite protein ofd1 isoform X4 n=1 Tax=Sinocyclocheilus anshuiensis TaxID=1608454 RepID=UPI0007B83A1B|nr:PREDICTED: oral-facial-digital syndrome 1 protein isoform X4 [Sinocyclocheilus anshuiensis]
MMMSGSEEQSLSPDEMRQKLYQTFRSRGLLDALKTQLRNQLIQELHPAAVRRGDAHSVLVTACNSVVVHHLRSVGCDYTLSVFLPECGMSKDQVLSARELLQLTKISPHTPLYKSLVSNIQKGQTGFLMSLFTELTEHHVYRDCCDASTQSTSISAHRESLVEKLQLIDEEYEVLRHRGDRWASVEAKLAEYRKEIQEQAQVELKAKLQHFMEVEIAKVKRDEKEASRREILELRRDMERTFELKSEALMSREKNAIERLQKSQEIEEKEIYAQRQALLKEIESVRSREIELKQRMEAFDKTCKLHEEKVKTMDDLLRRRELSVKTMEDTFDQKLKSELAKYQLELKEDYAKRTEKLTENENRIKEETVRLQKESAVIDAKAEEHERSLSEVKRLLMELESSRSQASLLAQQNELLRERLENMSDYPALKRDTQELQTHIRLLKQQLEEKRQEKQRLRQELSAPSKEQLALQAELRRLETEHKLDEDDFETQKNVLHTQLQHEVQQCALLKAQLMECEEQVKWMNTHAEELKLQLQQTQQERRRTSPDSDRAPLVFPERQISPIPAGESLCSISPPSSPRMKSTTRHSRSPPKLQEVISSSSEESSPQPEKITLHDLTDPVPLLSVDQECVLENLQESHTDEHDTAVKKEEEERKRREERRKREREEAQEREEQELQRLQQQLEEQHEEQAREDREDTEAHVTLTSAAIGGADEANPLHKYMMMLMQDKQEEQSPNKEASEKQSQEEVLQSENNDRSVDLMSREEPDDDFW